MQVTHVIFYKIAPYISKHVEIFGKQFRESSLKVLSGTYSNELLFFMVIEYFLNFFFTFIASKLFTNVDSSNQTF